MIGSWDAEHANDLALVRYGETLVATSYRNALIMMGDGSLWKYWPLVNPASGEVDCHLIERAASPIRPGSPPDPEGDSEGEWL